MYLKNILATCAILLCCISISLSFSRWAPLDGTSWNWICFLFFTSCLTMILTLHRILSPQKKEIFLSKGEIMGGILLCNLSIYFWHKGIDLYESQKLLASICLFFTLKQMQEIYDNEKIICYILLINAILSITIGLVQIVFGSLYVDGMQDSICHFSLSLTFGGIATSHLFKISKTKASKLIYLCILFACLTMLIVSQSRIGIITFAFCTNIFFHKYLRVAILTICILAGMLLFIHKNDSTLGRMTIYSTTISILHSPQQIFFGQGANGFRHSYMPTQAERLKGASHIERYRADNISHPLNEYLLLVVNYGIISLILILLIFISILYSKKINRWQKTLLTAIGLFAMFSYPFQYPITWIVFVWCLSHGKSQQRWCFKKYHLATPVLGVVCLYFAFNHFRMMEHWIHANNLRIMGKLDISRILYENIYKSPYCTSSFLYNYASFLVQDKKYNHSLAILKECKINNYDTELLKGDIYFARQQYTCAITHYKTASEMCPNRFVPLYAIYLSYGLANKKQSQKNMAKSILTKEIKIKSPIITKIINNVKQNNM